MAYESAFLLNKIPCAQCGKPIASPLWSERERNRVSFLWSCRACDYQFVTIAILKSPAPNVQEPPAPRRQPPAIAA